MAKIIKRLKQNTSNKRRNIFAVFFLQNSNFPNSTYKMLLQIDKKKTNNLIEKWIKAIIGRKGNKILNLWGIRQTAIEATLKWHFFPIRPANIPKFGGLWHWWGRLHTEFWYITGETWCWDNLFGGCFHKIRCHNWCPYSLTMLRNTSSRSLSYRYDLTCAKYHILNVIHCCFITIKDKTNQSPGKWW